MALKQIDFTMNNGREYIMLFDDDKMTEEQALTECQFVGWGGGHNYSLFPHYLIVEKEKQPILWCIKEHIREQAYEDGYNERVEEEEF